MTFRSALLATLALPLLHCATPAEDGFSVDPAGADLYDSWMNEMAVGQAAPPIDMDWYVPPMVFGENAEVLVTGGPSNRTMVFVASANVGAPGACPAAIAPECMGVPAPFTVLTTTQTNAAGEATFTLRVPPSLPFSEVVIQAISVQGPDVYLTRALTAELYDAPTDAEIVDVRSGLFNIGDEIRTQGIVTGVSAGGYFLQDPTASSLGGIYIFDGFASVKPAIGDMVSAIGLYEEFASGAAADSLAELVTGNRPSHVVMSSGNPLPAPVAIDPDTFSDLAALEAVESMLVTIGGGPLTVNTDLGFSEYGLAGAGFTSEGVIDDLLFDYEGELADWGIGATTMSVTGPMYFSFGAYKQGRPDRRQLLHGLHRRPAGSLRLRLIGSARVGLARRTGCTTAAARTSARPDARAAA
jgi:hypothetical protein